MKKEFIIGGVICLLFFAAGIVLGYFLFRPVEKTANDYQAGFDDANEINEKVDEYEKEINAISADEFIALLDDGFRATYDTRIDEFTGAVIDYFTEWLSGWITSNHFEICQPGSERRDSTIDD